MGVFDKAWMLSDVSKAMESVQKASNEKLLCRISSESPHAQVRLAAASKITSPQWLIKCAETSDDETLTILSTRAQDDATRCGILLASPVKGQAADRLYESITDEALLLKIALCGRYRIRGARRITDPEKLRELSEALLEKGGPAAYTAGSIAAEKSGMEELICSYAMKSADLSQWNQRKAAYTALMNRAEYNAQLSRHLRALEIDAAREKMAMAVKENA
ncbi:MAG: hypothetical protein IIZ17_00045 [Eubacteriaceae bacterium]|nr:hypothetical protein [Eubacteriaceae bacterium]